jgi:hypothetical protein
LALLNFSEHKRQLSGTSRSKLTRKLLLLLAYVLCSEGSRSSPIYSGGRARSGRPGCPESPLRRRPTAGIDRLIERATCCARRDETRRDGE